MTKSEDQVVLYSWRHYFVLLALLGLLASLIARALYLQVVEKDFLTSQAGQRQIRTIGTPAYRGAILDRFGAPLAISTPVDSVWVNPAEILQNLPALKIVARKLELDYHTTVALLEQKINKEFVYLKRQLEPELARRVADGVDGVYLKREYHRYYPAGEVVSHLVGFTDIDDRGQEGLELIHDNWLKAQPGERQVVRDRRGAVVENIAQVKRAISGNDLTTSIDMRLQYIAYRSLARVVKYHAARSGSAVILDLKTGEILAMVNQPSYNPNQRNNIEPGQRRNRALTDVLEPGSTVKPFTLAAGIDHGLYDDRSQIDTTPGWFMVSGHPIKDVRSNGKLDLAGILRTSSNVGASLIARSIPRKDLWQSFRDYGFGEAPGVSFPAESSGYLSHYTDWHPLDHATLGFGYGLSVSITQLARAYAVIANEGRALDISLIKHTPETMVDNEDSPRVMKADTAKMVLQMMEQVVGPGGTATRAAVAGYRISGKTGTVKKIVDGSYQGDEYKAIFAGIAPVSHPRLVMAVVIDEPSQNGYYGGQVAAPVFHEVMSHALRILDIAPDNLRALQTDMGT